MKLLLSLLALMLVAAGAVASSELMMVEPEDGIVQLPAVPANSDLDTAKNALEAVGKFIEIFNSDVFAATPIKPIAEVLSKVLSFVVSIINLVQGINSESAEMKFMREQFKEVHARLDGISLQLDDVKNLIEWRTTRVMYAEYEVFITATSHLLDNYVTAPEAEREIRRRQFVTAFQSKRLAGLKLYQAVVEKDFIIADNLGAAVVHYTQNHRRKVMNFLLAMNRLIMRGAQLEIAYEKLEHSENAAKVTEADWKIRMEKLVSRMKEIDSQVESVWHTQMQRDVQRISLEQRGLSNGDFSGHTYRFLADKFHWRHWFSLAYNEVSGFNNHAVSHCGGAFHFRTHGRNMVVASANPKTSRFTATNGDRLLAQAESAGHRTSHAEVWLNEINARVGGYCDDAAFRGAICWGCNVWWTVVSSRVSYRQMTVGGSVNTLLFG